MVQRVTIVGGTGDLGLGLALRLAQAGTKVVIASREPARARAAAARVEELVPGADVHGAGNAEAANEEEIVIVAVPFAAHADTIRALAPGLEAGQIVVDACVPLATAIGGKPTRSLGVWAGSAAEQAQELVPAGVSVISALHTVSAAALQDVEHRLDEDVLVCGDRKADKQRVAELFSRIDGLRCLDAGALDMSRIVEQLTPLIISLNVRYKARTGVRITGLP